MGKQNDIFLRTFIELEGYQQNPPKTTKDFISYCKERDINVSEEELEFYEKSGVLYPIARLRKQLHISEEGGKKKDYFPRDNIFNDHRGAKESLIELLNEDMLFEPKERKFKPWSTFRDRRSKTFTPKITSYYCTYQIHLLRQIQTTSSFTFNFSRSELRFANANVIQDQDLIQMKGKLDLTINYAALHSERQKAIMAQPQSLVREIEARWSFKKRIVDISTQLTKSEKVVKFLLLTQAALYPYGTSGGTYVTIKGDLQSWYNQRKLFKCKKYLILAKMSLKELSTAYGEFSTTGLELLGSSSADWGQLWKAISWSKKEKLSGQPRLGIEYLQWALMLKKAIEQIKSKEILDIDEHEIIAPEDIADYNADSTENVGVVLRDTRNKRYSDDQENHFKSHQKRKFYLANSFGIDIQPRVIVFLEGKTEEVLFPKVFEWLSGTKPSDIGIEFLNIQGVEQLRSSHKYAEELKTIIHNIEKSTQQEYLGRNERTRLNRIIKDLGSYDKIVASDWRGLITRYLEKWQTLPYFVTDNEGEIQGILNKHKVIRYYQNDYDVPSDLKYIWGLNLPPSSQLIGDNLELANFTNRELATCLSELANRKITSIDIQNLRKSKNSINKLGHDIKTLKGPVLANKLFEIISSKPKSKLQRPLFDILGSIRRFASTNHPPVDREIELKNIEMLTKWFQKGKYSG